jgi:ribonuclease T1
MRDGRTHPERRRVLWAAALLLLIMLALGACAAVGTPAPGRSGAQATPTPTRAPARQATLSSAASTAASTAAPTATPAHRATAAHARTPAAAQTPTKTRRAPATPTVALSGLPTIQHDRLPIQARETIDLIQHGGPFPYRQDGAVFQNRERLLPARPNGYYHEYTVKTPGSPDRGARRIIAGDKGELYYTDDHYDSFRQVVMP